MDELLTEFLIESFENLDQLDQDLVALEHDPNDLEVLKSIFRTIHTVKGTCGFLGLSILESVAHVGENLLSLLRDGVMQVDRPIADALMALTDAVRSILVNIEATQHEGTETYADLIVTLELLVIRAESGEAQSVDEAVSPVAAEPAMPEVLAVPFIPVPFIPVPEYEASPVGMRVGELLVEQGVVSQVDVAIGLIKQEAGDPRRIGEILTEAGNVTAEAVHAAVESQQVGKASAADATLRVDVAVLDKLMTLVGELVLARNQLLQVATVSEAADPLLYTTTQRLNTITSELQNGVMKTRMQPIGTVWSKFPRVARDVAAACGKQVRVDMDGKDTELDKTIIEAIKDPLTHVIRNSIDHGIESPEVRAERGKPVEGVVLLRASHEGGQVVIEIIDDGGGIDVGRVKAKAIEKGLIDVATAATMSERDATNLVFLPGFSTAEAVSNISGRGVGMDVVKTNIERIGGTIDLHSEMGVGSTLRIRIPLTLAIVPALIITCAGEKFAIPQVSLVELVGLNTTALAQSIEDINGAAVYRLRGRLLPLLDLRSELGFEASQRETATIVVLKTDDREFGLVVDTVNDTEEIVVKPLSAQIEAIRVFSGCTIMGDGRVALILDVAGVASRGSVSFEEDAVASDGDALLSLDIRRDRYIVSEVAFGRRVAISLLAVDRLEEIPSASIEHAQGREVVQYRGEILSLADLGTLTGAGSCDRGETVPVVVCTIGSQRVGVIVQRIVDIVSERFDFESGGEHGSRGVLGSAVVQGVVTDVVDIVAALGIPDGNPTSTSAEMEASYV